jgi:His-Xaa-Ser system radical SAM maturase HxsC
MNNMILRTKGKALNISSNLVGKVTKDITKKEKGFFLLTNNITNDLLQNSFFLAIISTEKEFTVNTNQSIVFKVPTIDHLSENDIVSIGIDGNINTLYRVDSFQNTLLATERCNSNCLMCSQPPKDREDVPILFDINSKVIPLIPKDCIEIGISGGEPTLMGDSFFELLNQIKNELPNTEVHVLTNGRSFAWNNLAEKLAEVNNQRLMLGIPIYSDYYQVHDHIVQAENAFYQTILGIHNLARYNQRIEIRIVLHKLSIPRLTRLARYIYKNLPFVEHVAFMGLEYIGYTPHNINELWIDPYDYQDELKEAVEFLAGQGMHVSVYNTPLCLLPEEIWSFARKSISDWKNDFLPECQKCNKLNECGGLFTWNLKKHSDYISPFIN